MSISENHLLTVKNVTKKFGGQTVLEDINLEFDSGIYSLLSPNGTGKTTLIKMLATLFFPTKGEILYGGTDILALDEKYREKIGYLPQEFGYYKGYTPHRYLKYLAVLKGVKNPENQIDMLLDQVSLTDVKDKKMHDFSGGMVRRVGIAQAMLGDPEVLILDEPTSGLDPNQREHFCKMISDYAKGNKTVIFSTHIVSDIDMVASTVVMFRDQKLLYHDCPSNICAALGAQNLEQAYRLAHA